MMTMLDFQTRTREISGSGEEETVKHLVSLARGLATGAGAVALSSYSLQKLEGKEGQEKEEIRHVEVLLEAISLGLYYMSEICNFMNVGLEDLARRGLENKKEEKAKKG